MKHLNSNIDAVIFCLSAVAGVYFTFTWAQGVDVALLKQATSQFVAQLALAF